MSKIYDGEIKRMQKLINFGNDTSKSSGAPVVEYHVKAADGKTYGILRECNKFYIKVAPKKDTEILAEDYDYIGGYMNKKANEYTTYSVASKQFDVLMKEINESCGSKKVIEQFHTVKPAEWQINETKEMRNEIDRFNQIVNNSILIEEGKEAETTYVGTTGDKGEKPENGPASDTYTESPDKKGAKTKGASPYTEKPKADKSDGYDIKGTVAEGKTVKLTEEQVLAWNRHADNYMDKRNETSVGSSAPYTDELGSESNQGEADTDPIKEEKAVHNTDDQNFPRTGTGDVGNGDPYMTESEDVDPDDVEGFDEVPDKDEDYTDDELSDLDPDDDEEYDDDVPFPEAEPGYEQNLKGIEDVSDDAKWRELVNSLTSGDDDDGYLDDTDFYESRGRKGGERIYEVVLNDFGKHPAYRKEPMTYPNHNMPDRFGKDWNDDSTKGNSPYGNKIGNGDPYTEKVIDVITDSIFDAVKKKD
jgi:hypothetical protein